MEPLEQPVMQACRILTLDGGGSRGVYTLGVLHELEKACQKPLIGCFDAFFGTSTGSIIASLLSLGRTVDEVTDLYFGHIPHVMSARTRFGRTRRLKALLESELGELRFDAFKKYTGIVTASRDELRPKIFKSSVDGAHGRKASFQPGFGRTIAEAVQASCAAYPFFSPVNLVTPTTDYELMDGGFCANNPTLFALIDAISAFNLPINAIKVLNVGTGAFPGKKRWSIVPRSFRRFVSDILTLNSNSIDIAASLVPND